MSDAAETETRPKRSREQILNAYTGQWNYSMIKKIAPMLGLNVPDLLANTTDADPFYIGPDDARPGVLAWAKWIADVWPRLGFTRYTRVHDRRIHYKLLSLGDVRRPEGTKFAGQLYGEDDNRDTSWEQLIDAVKYARYLHLLPYDQIEDQRNPKAANTYHLDRDRLPPDPSLLVYQPAGKLELPLPGFPSAPDYSVRNYSLTGYLTERRLANQRYHLEVWCEKTTMDDILEPWCQAHGAVFVTASGQMTVTGAWEAAEHRIRARGKPAVLLYISDFDKAGQSMPLAIARKIERFLRVEFADQDPPRVLLQQVALTYEQVQRYKLPDAPESEGDAAWRERYHRGKVELDALEVYRPGELKRMLNRAVAPYWDATLAGRIVEAAAKLRSDLDERREPVIEQHREQLAELEKRWDGAAEKARELLEPVCADIQAEHAKIAQELEDAMPDLADYPLPDAEEADPALAEQVLFDSERTYWTQLAAYRKYKEEHVVDAG
jgi:hypothetical protein